MRPSKEWCRSCCEETEISMEELQVFSDESISDIRILSVKEVISYNSAKKLNLQPEFQRRKVWPKAAKSYLIDTILRGLPMPEIFAYSTKEGGMAVIDGQQRLSVIIDFATANLHAWTAGKIVSFEDLSTEQVQAFHSYRIVFRVIKGSDSFLVRDIFQRLNRYVVALNPQELRHARAESGIISLAEALSSDAFWIKSGLVRSAAFQRMKEVEFVLELLIAASLGPQDGTRESLDRAIEKIQDLTKAQLEYTATLDLAKKIFREDSLSGKITRGDFYSLFLVFKQLKGMKVTEKECAKVKQALYEFKEEVHSDSPRKEVLDYLRSSALGSSHVEQRQVRAEILMRVVKNTLRH